MKTYTIAEILDSEVGMIIPRVEAKLQKVWDRKTGEGEHGAWSLQNGELVDATGSIKVCFSGLPNISERQGDVMVFRAQSGKKGLSGIKVDENTYKGATSKQLKITKSAIILGVDEQPDDIPMEYPAKTPETFTDGQLGDKNCPKPIVAPKKAIPADGVQVVKHRVMQLANLREICDHAAHFLYPEGEYGQEFIKDIATSIFIQSCRENLHDKLPNTKPISKKEDVEASENLEEKEDEIF